MIEEPIAEEIMSADPHESDEPGHDGTTGQDAVTDDHHAPDDHGEDHGHDDHGHADEPLGPLDLWAWGAGALGVVLGLAVAASFVLATA
jgi:hypothetical protein